jgi:GNAT superfamily N-acetyltransferase
MAAAVTHLEMNAAPALRDVDPPAGTTLRLIDHPDPDWYLTLFRTIGQDWLWEGRLRMDRSELIATIQSPEVDLFVLESAGKPIGMFELDRRRFPEIEIAYFGVVSTWIGKGAGAYLMSEGMRSAWSHRPSRVTVHTCTFDHPKALAFYQRAGFRPYKRSVEIGDDPRLTGLLPRSAAPQVPIIEP